jgi:2-dehydropantoate 2-reductase
MRICVVGAGAIGGMLGAKLALTGQEVTLIARGTHLKAIQKQGIKLIMADGTVQVARQVAATSRIREIGRQDVVVLALKCHQIESVAEEVATLIGPDSTVVTTQNGIPWWYFHRHGGPLEGTQLKSVDPNGLIAAHIDSDRVIGCIAYPAAEIVEPGVVRHIEGYRFPVGELDGSESPRARMVSELFTAAGFKAPILTDFRSELWLKLWGNLTFNPVSALTHATLVDICQFPLTRRLAAQMMAEAQRVAEKLGVTFRVPIEKRIAGAERVGDHKTSMLQDVEQGKAIEIDALLGAVIELGRLTDTPTPHLEAVYACTKLLARLIDEERVRVRAEPLGQPFTVPASPRVAGVGAP